jgi:gamma-glutamyl:cysteine ligase YbdK (ATP-grasp superfamily)
MGIQVNRADFSDDEYQRFEARLADNLDALRACLATGALNGDHCSLGAELELVIIDGAGRPQPLNGTLIEAAGDPGWQLELDCFNLEYNLAPVSAAGRPFSAMRGELDRALGRMRAVAQGYGARLQLIGILPTLKAADIAPSAMTALPRYRALSEGIRRLRKEPFEVDIEGEDRLRMLAEDVTLEGANTSFQLHLRVPSGRFARLYNALQLATAPALAASTNSPLFLGHRLWEETRIALFKQAVDTRVADESRPRSPPRVSFGTGWLRDSALELFVECASLYPPLIPLLDEEDPRVRAAQGRVPRLGELRLHTGTVWRWNRPVYDPDAGGHLRIEARTLPAGPTTVDMLASAAYLLGLSHGLAADVPHLIEGMPFGYAAWNFYRAAQHGLDAQLVWPGRYRMRALPARSLAEELLPVAARGLSEMGVAPAEASEWLAIVAARIAAGTTGARWQRRRFAQLRSALPSEQASVALVSDYGALSQRGDPVHTWPA